MTLDATPAYPNSRSYVLKLHREAAPSAGRIAGRLEHLVSGRRHHFESAAELIACLAAEAAAWPDVASSTD